MSSDWESNFEQLLTSIMDGRAGSEEFLLLENLLSENPAAVDAYVALMKVDALLHWRSGLKRASSVFPPSDRSPASPAPVFNLLNTAYHGTANFFSQDVPFACLMSALFMIVGGIFGSLITKEHYTQMPGLSSASAERSYADAESEGADKASAAVKEQTEVWKFVGRITGMADCRWANPGRTFSSITDYSVALHDKYSLTSGLMEITYNTGAKVILQGPCTYEVDSAASGYLSVGKLTARVEKKGAVGAGRGAREEAVARGQWSVASESTESQNPEIPKSLNSSSLATNSNPQSLIPNPSPSPQSLVPSHLFAVRTPTALVTDLGTEFGVEVNQEGTTESLVLAGSVRVQLVTADGQNIGPETILRENDSALVAKPRTGDLPPTVLVHRNAAQSGKFARSMPKPKRKMPMQVLAHFRMGEDDPGAAVGSPANSQTVNHAGPERLDTHGSIRYVAAAVPGSTLAAEFSGDPGTCFLGKDFSRFIVLNNFILEAWVRVDQIKNRNTAIVFNGSGDRNGFGFNIRNENWHWIFGGVRVQDSKVKCELGKWTHLALVSDHGTVQFWIDGRPAGAPAYMTMKNPDGDFKIGGGPASPLHSLKGQIDEVRFSTFQGAFQPAMLLTHEETASEPK